MNNLIYKFRNDAALNIAAIYIVVSSLWILFSDNLLLIYPRNIILISTAKGWIYTVVVGVFIYHQIKKRINKILQDEKKLKESEERFEHAMNASNDGLFDWDLKTNAIYYSPGWKKIIGYEDYELPNDFSVWEKTTDPDDVKKSWEMQQKLISKQIDRFMLEFKMKHKAGHWVDVLSRAKAIFDDKGTAVRIVGTHTDITERKQAEEALTKSQKRYQSLFDNSPVPLWEEDFSEAKKFIDLLKQDNVKDFNTYFDKNPDKVKACSQLVQITDINNAVLKLHEAKSKEELMKGLPYIFTDKSYEAFTQELVAIAEEKTNHEFEAIVKTLKGKERMVNLKWMVVPGYEDTMEKVYISTTDITEQKQAQAELTKLSTAVQQSPSIIAITDVKGDLQYVNPKYTKLTGYNFEEIIGQNHRVLKSGEQTDEFYKDLWKTISSGNPWRGEIRNKKKNGELFWELASISPIFDEQGKIVNYIKVAEDITERKQAEDNFRHSIDNSPLGIRIVNKDGKTIYVNKVFLDIYEFSSLDEFLNTRALERYTKKSYQEHQDRKKIRKKGGDTNEYEISIRRKNGEIRHIKVWRKEVIWNREKHYQVINQDVTELKKLYTDLLLAKEKAEESNRLKTAFLNNMSHEIRTPLNGITGFIGLLQGSEVENEEKLEYFDIINKSADRLIATVTDIMDISRIEAGLVKVLKTKVSVNEILEEQYKFFNHQAKTKGINLIYKPSLSDKETRFVTDKHKLEGILTNLIKNAIKFTEQGEITFTCSLKKEKDIEVLEFYVKDTGIGIPTNRLEAVFNRFEQADIEDVRAFQGSGLGLAIAKSYVEMLGGTIRVTSEVGKGSTFTFSIPYTNELVEESDAKENTNKDPQVSLSDLSVIIAEDDETSIMLFDAIFKSIFNKITYTNSGKETIDKCLESPETNIILMDIKMPDMNGYEATREIRKFNSDVVIIAQTAFGLAGDRERAIDAGCDDYIAKPIKKEILLEKIRAWVNKKNK